MRVDNTYTDIGTVTFINILTANIFDKLVNYLKEQVTAISTIKYKICE